MSIQNKKETKLEKSNKRNAFHDNNINSILIQHLLNNGLMIANEWGGECERK